MSKLIVPVAFVAALAASSAFASAKNFEGFSVGLNANMVSPELQRSDTQSWSGAGETSARVTNFDLGLLMQYDFAIGDKFVFGVGGETRSEHSKDNLLRIGDGHFNVKFRDSSSLYLAPGYALSENWLIYGKLAELNARVGKSDSVDFHGHGLGIGARYALSKNWQLQAELMRNNYKSKKYSERLEYKLHSTALSFGVLYKF